MLPYNEVLMNNYLLIKSRNQSIKKSYIKYSTTLNKRTVIPRLFIYPLFINSITIPSNIPISHIKSVELSISGSTIWSVPFSLLRRLSKIETTSNEQVIFLSPKMFFKTGSHILTDIIFEHMVNITLNYYKNNKNDNNYIDNCCPEGYKYCDNIKCIDHRCMNKNGLMTDNDEFDNFLSEHEINNLEYEFTVEYIHGDDINFSQLEKLYLERSLEIKNMPLLRSKYSNLNPNICDTNEHQEKTVEIINMINKHQIDYDQDQEEYTHLNPSQREIKKEIYEIEETQQIIGYNTLIF